MFSVVTFAMIPPPPPPHNYYKFYFTTRYNMYFVSGVWSPSNWLISIFPLMHICCTVCVPQHSLCDLSSKSFCFDRDFPSQAEYDAVNSYALKDFWLTVPFRAIRTSPPRPPRWLIRSPSLVSPSCPPLSRSTSTSTSPASELGSELRWLRVLHQPAFHVERIGWRSFPSRHRSPLINQCFL